jgi:peptidoglycan/LPS O-acetylase OafA/YrhL
VAFLLTFLLERGGNIHAVGAFLINAISHLFFIQEYVRQQNFVGGSWTLSLEMIWYVIISALFLFSVNKKTISLVIFSLVASLIAEMACGLGHHLPMGRLSMLLCCVLGLVCYRWDKGMISGRVFAVLSALLACGIASNLFVGFQLFPGPHPNATFKMVAGSWSLAAMIFFIPFLTRRLKIWEQSVLSFLGRVSYSVYLLHPIVLYVLLFSPVSGVPLVVITFVVTLCLATLTYRFIELPPISMVSGAKRCRTLYRDPFVTVKCARVRA